MTARAPYRIDAEYREVATLADGTELVFRLLRPSDRGQLARGFEKLSPESKQRRFLSPKGTLTESDLRYLTELDGVTHVALVALREDNVGREEGVGVARYAVLPDEAAVAEPAVTVIDAYQRRGLGRMLLERLVAIAVERGITAFRATVLVSNAPMLALVRELAPGIPEVIDGEEISIDMPLAAPAVGAPHDAPGPMRLLEWLLRLAGQGAFVLLSGLRRVAGTEPPVERRDG